MAIDLVQHKDMLIKILKDIYPDAELSGTLGFKGGTAAMLFYGLNRFSVDLDFDILNFDLLDESKENIIIDKVSDILKNYGTIKEARNKRYNIFFLLRYDSALKNAQNIKVEINKRNFGSKYDTRSYLGLPIDVMTQADMAAHKLVAMYERMSQANRDIYDVWFFLQNGWPINKQIIEMRTQMKYPDFLQKCIDGLENLEGHSFLSGLGELLDEKQKYWVKTKLKNETIFLL